MATIEVEKTIFIYGLHGPDDDTIMYIGQSSDPRSRLIGHITEARYGKVVSPKNEWILSLLAAGKEPQMTILDTCFPIAAGLVEGEWIAAMVNKNPDLKNRKYVYTMTRHQSALFLAQNYDSPCARRAILDGPKIAHRMIDVGIRSFADLAKGAGVNKAAITAAMGTNRWQARTVEKLATKLECSPLDLITVEGDKQPTQ